MVLLRWLDRTFAIALALAFVHTIVTFLALDFSGTDRAAIMLYTGMLGAGALVAWVWTRRANADTDTDARWMYLLRYVIRLGLGYMMLFYGTAKLIPPLQFGDLPLAQLDKPFYSLTPFWKAWTFYGHSYLYPAVAGFVETTSGILVLFDRTERLALCMMLPLLLDVALVNYVYHVNVLVLAVLLVVGALYLLAIDVPWAVASFWTEQPALPRVRTSLPLSWQKAKRVTTWIFLCVIAGQFVYSQYAYPSAVHPSVYGIWRVEDAQASAAPAWTKIYFDGDWAGGIRTGDSVTNMKYAMDTLAHRVTVMRDSTKQTILDAGYAMDSMRKHLTLVLPSGVVRLRREY